MEPLISIVIGAVALVPILAVRYAFNQRTLKSWRSATQRFGMRVLSVSQGLSHPHIQGLLDDFWISIEARPKRRGRRNRITLRGSSLPFRLELRPESIGTSVTKLFEGSDIQTGDPVFDATVLVRGDPYDTAAVLGGTTRPLVVQALRRGVRVENGQIVLETGDTLREPDTLVKLARELTELARALKLPTDVPGRLVQWVTRDPCPEARLRFLTILLERYPSDPRTELALRHAQQDRSPEVRLAAAIAAGEAGRSTLELLVGNAETPEDTACRAVAALGRALETEPALAALDGALTSHKPALARALLGVLAVCGDARAVERLVALLAEPDVEAAAVAARALEDCRGTGVELALTTALGSARAELRRAAAESLAKVGTVAAVAPLRAAAAAHPLDLGLHRASAAAVAAIQARCPGAAPGQVSLAGGDAGRLSLTTRDEGLLALATPDPPDAEPKGPGSEGPAPGRPRQTE